MAIGHGKITLKALYVEGQGADLLNGIDAEQYITRPATFTQARQVQAQTPKPPC